MSEKEIEEIYQTIKCMAEEPLQGECSETPRYHNRKDVLSDAETCVCGHREQDYGSPENNFQIIADL